MPTSFGVKNGSNTLLIIFSAEEADVDGVVLCLPPGCYGLAMSFSGLPGFQGLPGMTMSLEIGGEEQVTVDLALIDGVFELEFGVLTDCESSIEGSPEAEPAGLSVFPNPSNGAAFARLDGAVFDGRVQWVLSDGLGRVVLRGTSVFLVVFGSPFGPTLESF